MTGPGRGDCRARCQAAGLLRVEDLWRPQRSVGPAPAQALLCYPGTSETVEHSLRLGSQSLISFLLGERYTQQPAAKPDLYFLLLKFILGLPLPSGSSLAPQGPGPPPALLPDVEPHQPPCSWTTWKTHILSLLQAFAQTVPSARTSFPVCFHNL